MIYIGSHLSSAGGYEAMGRLALDMGETTFAFFTRNPRGGKAKELDLGDMDRLVDIMSTNQFGPLVAHAPYTMNLCASKERVLEFSREVLIDDLRRLSYMPGHFYNFHPGSHVGQGTEAGIALIADALICALREMTETASLANTSLSAGSPSASSADTPLTASRTRTLPTVLLETMTGKGSEIGGTFEELREILDRVDEAGFSRYMGVCFDTCHTWDAGYDIAGDLDGVLTQFDKIIGLERLKAVHFNDSLNERGAKKDRHARLGEGRIGLEALKRVALHPALDGRPFVLETPNETEGYIKEIKMIRSWL